MATRFDKLLEMLLRPSAKARIDTKLPERVEPFANMYITKRKTKTIEILNIKLNAKAGSQLQNKSIDLL